MARAKASDVVVIRKLIQARPGEVWTSMLGRLSTTRARFMSITASEWITLDEEAEILAAAAATLHPDDPRALQTLAREVAKINFSGIYKAFLQIATPAFIIKRISGIWRTFYEQGEAWVEEFGPRHYALVATGLPELPAVHREYNCGFIAGVLELTNTRGVTVAFDGSRPEELRWVIRWE